MVVEECHPRGGRLGECDLVLSGLDSSVATEVEAEFALAGIPVFSNAKNYRTHPKVPLVIPLVNPDHLDTLIAEQRKEKIFGNKGGFIVTNPNCTTIGLVTALKPLYDAYGLDKVAIFSMQAISGAGFPGMSAIDMTDNVVPFISGEEDKVEKEPLKILGTPHTPAKITLTAHCNRVSVTDGHTECVSLQFHRHPFSVQGGRGRGSLLSAGSGDEGKETLTGLLSSVFSSFRGPPSLSSLCLPSTPDIPLLVHSSPDRPQPRLDRDRGGGFTTSVGRIRQCPLLHAKFVLVSHNTIFGAAGCSILNAEYAAARGLLVPRSPPLP